MNVTLVVEKGLTREHLQLHADETVVGRHRECNLRIPSADVSRRHCILSFKQGLLFVRDLESLNGTFLNGIKAVDEQVVRPGDHLEVGPVAFKVEYELAASANEEMSVISSQPENLGSETVTLHPVGTALRLPPAFNEHTAVHASNAGPCRLSEKVLH